MCACNPTIYLRRLSLPPTATDTPPLPLPVKIRQHVIADVFGLCGWTTEVLIPLDTVPGSQILHNATVENEEDITSISLRFLRGTVNMRYVPVSRRVRAVSFICTVDFSSLSSLSFSQFSSLTDRDID